MNRQNLRRGKDYARQMRVWLRLMENPQGESDPARRAVALVLSQQLSLRQKECLRRYYRENQNMETIGAGLGLHPSTVSRHICRGEERVCQVLELARQMARRGA